MGGSVRESLSHLGQIAILQGVDMSDCTNCRSAGVAISGTGFRCPNHGATFNANGVWSGGQRTNGLFEFTVAINTTTGTLTITS